MKRLNRLLSRVECDPPLFTAEEISDWPPGLPIELVLQMAAPATTAPCPACDGEQTGRVVALGHSLQIVCRQCGPSPVSGDVLRRWEFSIPALLEQLAPTLGLRSTVSELVPGHLWNWGTASWAGRSRNVVFARRAHRAIQPITASMSRRAASVVFVVDDTGVLRWTGDSRRLIPLTSVLAETATGLHFDREFILTIFADEPARDGNDRRPQKRRSTRAAGIESLVHEMQRHLIAARDYARDSQTRFGTPKLLPRPSQADLAQLTHLSESAVSRCLKDDSAILLQLLWQTAEDLDRVMAWSGAIRPPGEDYD